MNAATVVEAVPSCASIFLVVTTAAVCRATLYKVTRNLAKVHTVCMHFSAMHSPDGGKR